MSHWEVIVYHLPQNSSIVSQMFSLQSKPWIYDEGRITPALEEGMEEVGRGVEAAWGGFPGVDHQRIWQITT